MKAAELIIHTIPTLTNTDKSSAVLKLMNEFHTTHLPVLDEKKFLGLVSEEDLLNINKPDESIGSFNLKLTTPFIHDYEHIFEVLKVASVLHLKIIPVTDKDNNYLGSITSDALLYYLAHETDLLEPGGIIVLQMAVSDYTLTEVARIIESNSTRILSVFANTNADNNMMELTIKVNTPNLQVIIQALQRFNYIVKDSYQEPEFYDDLKDRYDSLMNYLNV
ncbi:MAG: CBS domain-containing protein [Ignavibacteria bacterium]|nr:CBS domain-containing protein [Ignavibacteria bacterium]